MGKSCFGRFLRLLIALPLLFLVTSGTVLMRVLTLVNIVVEVLSTILFSVTGTVALAIGIPVTILGIGSLVTAVALAALLRARFRKIPEAPEPQKTAYLQLEAGE